MSDIPADLHYSETHEWIKSEGEHLLVGITDHAQQLLGDIVFVELPEVGSELNKGQEFGVIESVKAASDLYMPVSGEIIEVNQALMDTPDEVNQSPYESGWLLKVRMSNEGELEQLKSAEAYAEFISEE